jgi:hypothetical protein
MLCYAMQCYAKMDNERGTTTDRMLCYLFVCAIVSCDNHYSTNCRHVSITTVIVDIAGIDVVVVIASACCCRNGRVDAGPVHISIAIMTITMTMTMTVITIIINIITLVLECMLR